MNTCNLVMWTRVVVAELIRDIKVRLEVFGYLWQKSRACISNFQFPSFLFFFFPCFSFFLFFQKKNWCMRFRGR